MVTDPKTETFKDLLQLRDAFLIPIKDYPAAKDVYNSAVGHYIEAKQSPSALLNTLWDKFNL